MTLEQIKLEIKNLTTIFSVPPWNLIKDYSYNLSLTPLRKNDIYFFEKYSDQLADFQPSYMKTIYDTTNNLICHVYHLYDMYVTYSGCFSDGVHLIQPDNEGPYEIRMTKDGPVIDYYENVIAVGHSQIMNYGHHINDFLSPLMIIPEEIQNKSVIVGYGLKNLVLETLNALGFENKIKFLEEGQWIFAKNLYACARPRPHLSHFGVPQLELSRKLRKFYKVDKIEPTNYYLSNRNTKIRSIYNFNELFEAAKTRFPEIKWKTAPDLILTVRETALIWSKAKFMFTVTGSNSMKAIFMSSDSVFVDVIGNLLDPPIIKCFLSVGVKVVIFSIKNMKHFEISENIVDIPLAMKAFETAIYYINNKKWPPTSDGISFVC
ncbi:hypothetical protein TVAG_403220 [Trichomonas vaginalis G3]|uniref:Glycosyltransferase 61 catalytic domain-containing protein n=1 Tax=Trichomonas vaginalis (strain ATCC PRA-98 / G3) TaxID=412133 RepID=A2F8V8_TRIV3|nr:glycosyltransferase family [Trichomonas vaginalis G3]EAX98640.1 hypothetical protein TVAG_403220 [Trichomonas vaginalis G3]KAI5508446.1 glycosyltransferase family [Trichomonas vaginalis G3]|eukprot:XP_001311570.1 hypothetical protein [Trichomonas vaginalis G3]